MLSQFFNIDNLTKICNKCKIDKLLSQFYKKGSSFQYICKVCTKEYGQLNKQKHNECGKRYYQQNKESVKTYQKENKESIKEYYREYQLVNKGRYSARDAKRRASKLKATPFWSEFDLIVQLYNDCKLISEMTGILHHVDHIVPLQSDIVCGLHCISNLQIITAKENITKSNSFVINQ